MAQARLRLFLKKKVYIKVISQHMYRQSMVPSLILVLVQPQTFKLGLGFGKSCYIPCNSCSLVFQILWKWILVEFTILVTVSIRKTFVIVFLSYLMYTWPRMLSEGNWRVAVTISWYGDGTIIKFQMKLLFFRSNQFTSNQCSDPWKV